MQESHENGKKNLFFSYPYQNRFVIYIINLIYVYLGRNRKING